MTTRTASDFGAGEAVGVVVGGRVVPGVVRSFLGGGAWSVDVGGRVSVVDVGALVRDGGGFPAGVRAAVLGAARGVAQAKLLRGAGTWAPEGKGARASVAALLGRINERLPAPWWAETVLTDGEPGAGARGRRRVLVLVDGLGNSTAWVA